MYRPDSSTFYLHIFRGGEVVLFKIKDGGRGRGRNRYSLFSSSPLILKYSFNLDLEEGNEFYLNLD